MTIAATLQKWTGKANLAIFPASNFECVLIIGDCVTASGRKGGKGGVDVETSFLICPKLELGKASYMTDCLNKFTTMCMNISFVRNFYWQLKATF